MQRNAFPAYRTLLVGTAVLLGIGLAVPAFAEAGFLDRMKADVAAATAPGGGTWDGPTTGPKAAKGKTVVFVSLTQNSSGNSDASNGCRRCREGTGLGPIR